MKLLWKICGGPRVAAAAAAAAAAAHRSPPTERPTTVCLPACLPACPLTRKSRGSSARANPTLTRLRTIRKQRTDASASAFEVRSSGATDDGDNDPNWDRPGTRGMKLNYSVDGSNAMRYAAIMKWHQHRRRAERCMKAMMPNEKSSSRSDLSRALQRTARRPGRNPGNLRAQARSSSST